MIYKIVSLYSFGSYTTNELYLLEYLFILSLVFLNITILPCLGLNYTNLQDNNFKILDSLKNDIIPIYRQNTKQNIIKYSIKLILKSNCPADIHKSITADPNLFLHDYLEILKFRIYHVSSKIIEKSQVENLRSLIDPNVYDVMLNVYKLNDESNIKEWLKLIRDTFLGSIIYMDYYDETGQIIDFNIFFENLNNFKLIYDDNKLKNKNYLSDELKYIDDFEASRNIYFDQYFKKSYFSNIINILKKENRYTNFVNLLLAKSYYQKISGQIKTIKINYNETYTPYYTNDIWSLIEKYIGVERSINDNDSIDNVSSFKLNNNNYCTYKTRIVKDKTFNNIVEKIKRKSNYNNHKNVQCFADLIKDAKRLSLVFNKESDIINFLNLIKDKFGSEYNREIYLNEGLKVRIHSIKNKFDVNKQTISINKFSSKFTSLSNFESQYMDLKIIFDVYSINESIGYTVECQCNLISLIQWKVADHIFYEFERGYDTYQVNSKRFKDYKFMESKFRKITCGIKDFIKFILIILIINIFIFTTYKYNDDYDIIQCYNDNFLCYNHCIGQETMNKECKYYFKNNLNNLSEKIIKHVCIKYQKEILISTICNNIFDFDKNLYFADGISNTNCVVILDSYRCLYNSNFYDLNKINSENKLIIGPNKYILLDKNNKILKDYIDFFYHDYLQNWINEFLDEEIYQIQLSKNRVCFLNFQNILKCSSSYHYYYQNYMSLTNDTFCLVKSNILNCFDKQTNKITPYTMKNPIQISSGSKHICTIDSMFTLHCQGSNDYGQTTIPSNFRYNIKYISLESYNSCAVTFDGELGCFGGSYDVTRTPELYQRNIMMVSVSFTHGCVLDVMYSMACWGSNVNGKTDVPEDQWYSIMQIGTGVNWSCAINSMFNFNCWGLYVNKDSVRIKIHNADYFITKMNILCLIKKDNKVLYCFYTWTELVYIESYANVIYFDLGYTSFSYIDGNGQIIWLSTQNKRLPVPISSIDPKEITIDKWLRKFEMDQKTIENVESFSLNINDEICYKKFLDCPDLYTVENGYMEVKNDSDQCELGFRELYCYVKGDIYQTYTYFLHDNEYCMTIDKFCYTDKEERTRVICEGFNKNISRDEINSMNGTKVKSISCGDVRVCALFEDGTVGCTNGINTDLNQLNIQMSTGAIAVKAGYGYVCVLKQTRKMLCNGYYDYHLDSPPYQEYLEL